MTKSLIICRAMHLSGHRVISAEVPRWFAFPPNRFSASVSCYYKLPDPTCSVKARKAYVTTLINIITQEKVDLWVPVSEESTTIPDCEAAEDIQKRVPSCKVFHLTTNVATTLHKKREFTAFLETFWPTTPKTHVFTDRQVLSEFLALDSENKQLLKNDPVECGLVNIETESCSEKSFFLKAVEEDNSTRALQTIVPRPTRKETQDLINSLHISKSQPWMLQDYIQGTEYCTMAVITKSQTRLFVACASRDVLMHYKALPSEAPLTRALMDFNQQVVRQLSVNGQQINGQICLDVIVRQKKESSEYEIYPIECNPRTHTAVTTFSETPLDLAKVYLDILNIEQGHTSTDHKCLFPSLTGRYWIGHDLVVYCVLPILQTLAGSAGIGLLDRNFREFLNHIVLWKEATFEIWDPLPWFLLYHFYLPVIFLKCIWEGYSWPRMNISTVWLQQARC